ncbi:MAG: hypothetical protein AAGH65_03000 [Pseudomonadota bacterium]
MSTCAARAARLGYLAALALLAVPTSIHGVGQTIELNRSVVAAGSEFMAAGNFELEATLGQPVVSRAESGDFVLQAGFWTANTAQVSDLLFQDGFE